MKVIKPGYTRRISCPKCDALLEYVITSNDVHVKPDLICSYLDGDVPYSYIKCPMCGREIDVTKNVKETQDLIRIYGV